MDTTPDFISMIPEEVRLLFGHDIQADNQVLDREWPESEIVSD
jgi:hypothetical protein